LFTFLWGDVLISVSPVSPVLTHSPVKKYNMRYMIISYAMFA
jgi:hypothetical protein